MPNFSKNDIILVRYPFSDLSNAKISQAPFRHFKNSFSRRVLITSFFSAHPLLAWATPNSKPVLKIFPVREIDKNT
jgi:hypothetical protein